MTTTRTVLVESTWKPLENQFPSFEKESVRNESKISLNAVVPLCLGYKEGTFNWDEFEAKIEGILEKNLDYTIYTYPKDAAALKEWEDEFAARIQNPQSILHSINRSKIKDIEIWRATPKWLEAKERYLDFCKYDAEKREGKINKVRNDYIAEFANKHPEMKEQYIKNYQDSHVNEALPKNLEQQFLADVIEPRVINEIIDVVSWHQKKPEAELAKKQKSPTEITILFYDPSKPQPMHNATQASETMGYYKSSFIKITSTYKKVLNQVEESAVQNESENVLYTDFYPDQENPEVNLRKMAQLLVYTRMEIDKNKANLEHYKDIAGVILDFVATKPKVSPGSSPPEENKSANHHQGRPHSRSPSPPDTVKTSHLHPKDIDSRGRAPGGRNPSPQRGQNGELKQQGPSKSTHGYLQTMMGTQPPSINKTASIHEKQNDKQFSDSVRPTMPLSQPMELNDSPANTFITSSMAMPLHIKKGLFAQNEFAMESVVEAEKKSRMGSEKGLTDEQQYDKRIIVY